MRKIIIFVALFLVFSCAAFAQEGRFIFIATINDCTAEEVQNVIINKMVSRNFTIEEITPYKMVFQKNFNDLGGYSRYFPQFNIVSNDNNVKLIVTQESQSQNVWGQNFVGQSGIKHLIPIIQEIKHDIDGTPIDLIKNEAVNQLPNSGNEPEKMLGIKLTDKDMNGYYRIKEVAAGSFAAEKGVYINDIIHEINGMSLSDMDKDAVESYIANKWGTGSSLVMVIEHEGQKNIISLKRNTK